MGEIQPPRLPHIFIMADSDPEKFCVRSLQVAHHVEVENILKPMAPERNTMASLFPGVWAPRASRRAEHVMPNQTAVWRPRRLPNNATARSENHPPSGARRRVIRKGAAPQRPPCFSVIPRTRMR